MVQRRGGKTKRPSHTKNKSGANKQQDQTNQDEHNAYTCECTSCVTTRRSKMLAVQASALKSSKTAVWQSCEGQTVPSEPQELYGAYLPSKGLIVSRVLQDGNILFTHPSYSTYSTEPLASSSFQVSQCDSAASTSSARPSASEASVTEASDREDSAVLPPSHRQTADEFAESFMSGQVLMFPAREEPETESDSEGHDVLTSELVPERHLLHQMPAIAKVSIVSGAGNKLSGVWPFPDNQCTVFDPTCRDTVITDAIFIGGSLVCYGACHVTFTNVHFGDCPVLALAGATVIFQHCSFRHVQNASTCELLSKPRLAVYAHACGTHVSLSSCCIECGDFLEQGVVAHKGAFASVKQTSFSGATQSAIEVRDEGSELDCTMCRIRGASHAGYATDRTAKPPDKGVVLYEGASASVIDTDIKDVGTGVLARSSCATLQDCVVSLAWVTCVAAESDSNVRLTRCLLEEAVHYELGHGASVSGRSKVALDSCKMQNNRHSGVYASGISEAVVVDCISKKNGEAGFAAEGEGSALDLVNCQSLSCSIGVWAFKSDRCKLDRVYAEDSTQSFVLTGVESSAVLTGCNANVFKEAGLVIRGEGVVAELKDCESTGSDSHYGTGLYVQEGGRVNIANSKITAGSAALGIAVGGEGSEVTAHMCQMTGGCGAHADRGAKLTLNECTTCKCDRYGVAIVNGSVGHLNGCVSVMDNAALLCQKAHVEADSCEFRDFLVGAEFRGPDKMESSLRDCKLTARREFVEKKPGGKGATSDVGVLVGGGGGGEITLNMTGCTVKGTRMSSVRVVDTGVTINLRGCVLSDSKESGVQISGGGSKVVMSGCTVKGHASFGVTCSGGHIFAEKTHSTRNKIGAYGVFERGSMHLTECSSDQDGSGCTALGEGGKKNEKGMPRVVLGKVLVRRARGFGFGFFNGVKCCMQHCSALQCGMQGIDIQGCFDGRPNVCISIFDCMFQKNTLAGVRARRGAIVSMRNVLSSDNKEQGFFTEQAGSQLKLTQCESVGNASPYQCDSLAVLECVDCQPEWDCKPARRSVANLMYGQ